MDRAWVSRALLQLRNTPDRDTKLSPAKALYGGELRNFLPRPGSSLMGEMWMNLADDRETALGRRATNATKEWTEHTRALLTLNVGDHLMIQNQSGNHPLRWDKRRSIVKAEGFDQYQVEGRGGSQDGTEGTCAYSHHSSLTWFCLAGRLQQ